MNIPEVSIDLETKSIEVTQPAVAVDVITAAMPSVSLQVPGPRGSSGPTGPTGLVKVSHGSDPNVVRPVAPLVYWVGSVQPVNADPDDLLLLKD